MDRGTKPRRDADRIALSVSSSGTWSHERGTLLLRSGLTVPRMPCVMGLAASREKTGAVADYYDGVAEAENRWLPEEILCHCP